MSPTIFTQLPELMKTIIDSERSIELNMAIEKEVGLTTKQGDAMMSVIRKVILQTITPAQLLETIQHDVQIREEMARHLALELLGRRFLPMQWFVGNVEGLITQLGGDVPKYLAEAKKNFPEVYEPAVATAAAAIAATPVSSDGTHPMLVDFEGRLTDFKGRAEVLLRLTGLSAKIETAMQSGAMDKAVGERAMQQLDTMSSAINTQDLNPLEVQSIKRRLTKILKQVGEL